MSERLLTDGYKAEIDKNFDFVRSQMAQAGGQNVILLAATKTLSADVINYAIDKHGLSYVGENRVQELVAKYDFAKHNGLSVRVSGLPNLYGVRLQVEYASGEFIHAYHNQSRFLTEEEMAALVALFYEQAETTAKDGESGEE